MADETLHGLIMKLATAMNVKPEALGKALLASGLLKGPLAGQLPGGLSQGAEDALVGVNPANRRGLVKGALGVPTPVGSIGSPETGRTTKL